MDILTIRFEENVLKHMDEAIEHNNYNSRTEFVREAVRDKLENLKQEALLRKFLQFKGLAPATSDDEDELVREKVSREYLKRIT